MRMKSSHRRPRGGGFTLMETMLALLIFSLAAVALAEAIQSAGRTSDLIRRDIQIHDRMTALTTETMRLIALTEQGARPMVPDAVVAEGVSYKVVTRKIENLVNKDKVIMDNLYEIVTTAEWTEGSTPMTAEDIAWVYPPLIPPLR